MRKCISAVAIVGVLVAGSAFAQTTENGKKTETKVSSDGSTKTTTTKTKTDKRGTKTTEKKTTKADKHGNKTTTTEKKTEPAH
ncbi:MAG: hypothetical protein DMF87_11375 [Acidobacteria bacterium]|nr:MAG: hypothetical protein DMF87_11375 [Acidobacteriota bacterium]